MTPQKDPRAIQFRNETNSLLLNEQYLQVQPGLRQLLGSDEGDIIQAIVYWRNHPHNDLFLDADIKFKKFDGLLYLRIPPELMFNEWTGKLRYINPSTAKKKFASLRSQGVLRTANLNPKAGDNINWYAVVHEVLDPLTSTWQKFWNQVIGERLDAAQRNEILGEAREKELLREYEEELEQVKAKLAKKKLIPTEKDLKSSEIKSGKPHFSWDEVQKFTAMQKAAKNALSPSSSTTEEGWDQNGPTPTHTPQYAMNLGANLPHPPSNLSEVSANSSHISDQNGPIYGTNSVPPICKSSESTRTSSRQERDDVDDENLNSFESNRETENRSGVETLTERLLSWAQLEGKRLDREKAQRIVTETQLAARAVATMSTKDLLEHFKNFKSLKLPTAIGGKNADILMADPEYLRWVLWLWPLHLASVAAQKGSKPNMCAVFCHRAGLSGNGTGEESMQLPSQDDFDKLVNEDDARLHAAERKRQNERDREQRARENERVGVLNDQIKALSKEDHDLLFHAAAKSLGNLRAIAEHTDNISAPIAAEMRNLLEGGWSAEEAREVAGVAQRYLHQDASQWDYAVAYERYLDSEVRAEVDAEVDAAMSVLSSSANQAAIVSVQRSQRWKALKARVTKGLLIPAPTREEVAEYTEAARRAA